MSITARDNPMSPMATASQRVMSPGKARMAKLPLIKMHACMHERLMRLRHQHDEIVSGNMHIHLGKTYCLEVFITEGDAEEVLNFISRIRAMRGIQQVKYTMVPVVRGSRLD